MTAGDAACSEAAAQRVVAGQRDVSSSAPARGSVAAASTAAPSDLAAAVSKGLQIQPQPSRRGSTGGAATGMVPVGKLPIHKHRDKILEHINNNFITCIQGETGCGKSTQVPKFLLDQDDLAQKTLLALRAEKTPPPPSIPLPPLTDYRPLRCIVTQPRRLACISLAQRVARELGEDTGGIVGYRISGESKTSRRTKIFFMTTGYLLQILINAQPALAHVLTEEELSLEAAGRLAALQQRAAAASAAEANQQQDQQLAERGSEGYLDDFTHVVLDEVHERDVDADLLSLVLKLQLRSRIGRLKIVVMSATMQGNLFFNYFSDIHLRNVPGEEHTPAALEQGGGKEGKRAGDHHPNKIFVGAKRFPVQLVYIDDLLLMSEDQTVMRPVTEEELSGAGLLMEGKDEEEEVEQESADEEASGDNANDKQYKLHQRGLNDVDVMSALLSRRGKSLQDVFSISTQRTLIQALRTFRDAASGSKRQRGNTTDAESGLQPDIQNGLEGVCVDLVSSLAHGGETILIFLPGIAEISTLFEALATLERPKVAQSTSGGGSTAAVTQAEDEGGTGTPNPTSPAFKLFVLHSTIGREEQTEVFSAPPANTCHVVLASNIAESSLTLPNCRIVIDFCLRRQLIYDPRRHASALVKAWTSHASSQQRSGRTGRVFPGLCIRLVSSSFYKSCLRVFDLPEMQTAPLDKLYITVAHLTKQLNAVALAANPAAPDQQMGGQTARVSDKPASIHECMRSGSLTPAQLLLLTVQPPPVSALTAAQAGLKEQGALDANGEITRLGYLMMQLPIDIRLCKLVFLGIAFGCPLDAIVLASCLASSDLFAFPALMLLQRHSKPSAGLEAALQLQQQLKTRALFDGGHFSEPLMLRNCFVEFLIHFASSTAELRARLARQAGPSRSKRLELNMKLEYHRAAREFGRGHAVLPKRLVQATLLCCDLSQRVSKLLAKSSAAYKSLSFLLELLQDGSIFPPHLQQSPGAKAASGLQQQPQQPWRQHQLEGWRRRDDQQEGRQQQQDLAAADTDKNATAVSYDPATAAAAVESRFLSDSLVLKALMAAAFSPSFMVGKLKTCLDGQQLVEARVDCTDNDKEESTAIFSWLTDRGVDVSRCLFFNRTFNTEKISQIHTALSAVLPGVDYVLISAGESYSSYISVRASSTAAAEDPVVGAVTTQRFPEWLGGSLILYFPPTPRNECFNFNYKTAGAAAVDYKKQLRSPPTAAAILQQQKQRERRLEQLAQKRMEECDSEEDSEDDEGSGSVHIGVPAVHDTQDLKQINERISQPEFIRGNHIEPCRLFSSHPVVAQLVNQFGCGRWKFTLPLPRQSSTTTTPSTADNGDLIRGIPAASTLFEMMRPTSPFAATWYFLGSQDTGASGSSSGKSSKPVKVQGILSYRSPMGVLGVCPEVVSNCSSRPHTFKQPGEIYAVAVAQQNKDSVSQAWAEGVTLLPQREAAILMLAFLPGSSSVELTVKASTDAPVAITSIEMLEGMRLSQAAHAPCITLADLLRANVLRHLLSKSLQGGSKAAAAASGPTSRARGRRGPVEALITGDNHAELGAALGTLLTRCNEPVSPAQVDELVILAGETPDPMLHLLFCKGLSILSDNPDHRGNSKKGLEPLSYSLSAFATPQREEPACLPPYNLRGIASYYNRLVQNAQRRVAEQRRKQQSQLPVISRRLGQQANKQKGRAPVPGGLMRPHPVNQMRGQEQRAHHQLQRQQQHPPRGSNRRRGRGSQVFRAGAGGRQQPQQGIPMVGLHSQMDPFSSGSGSGGLGRTLPDATGTRERTTQAAGQSFKRQHAAMPPQGVSASDGPWSLNTPVANSHQPMVRMDHMQGRVDTGLPPVFSAFTQQQAAAQHRYASGLPSLLQQHPHQHYLHQYRQPQEMQQRQQHAYTRTGYGLQQPGVQQSFMDASRLPPQQHMPPNAAGGLPLQQLQQLHIGAAVVPQQPHLQQAAYRGPHAAIIQQQLGAPAGHGGNGGSPHSVFGAYST